MAYASPTRKGASPTPAAATNGTTTTTTTLNLPPLNNSSSTATAATNGTTTTTTATFPPYAWPNGVMGAPAFPTAPMPYRMYGPHTVPMPVPVPVPFMSPRQLVMAPNAAGGNMVVQTTHTVRNNHVIRAKLHDKLARIKKALSVGKRSPRQNGNATTTTTQQTTTANPDGSTTTTTTTTSTGTVPPPPLAPLEIPPLGPPVETITTISSMPPLSALPVETTTTTYTIPPMDTTLWTPPVLSPGVLTVPGFEIDKLTVSSVSSTTSSTSESSPRLPDRILLTPPEDLISEADADAELRAELEALPSIPVDEMPPPPPPVEGDEDNAPPAPAEIVQDITIQATQQTGTVNKSVMKGVQIVRTEHEEDIDRVRRIDMRIAEITAANAIDDSDDADTEEEEERDTQAMLKRAMDGLHETERMINNSLERSQIINVTHKAAVEVNDGRGGTRFATEEFSHRSAA